MTKILEHCEKYFQTRNIYEILEISKTATDHEGKEEKTIQKNHKNLTQTFQ